MRAPSRDGLFRTGQKAVHLSCVLTIHRRAFSFVSATLCGVLRSLVRGLLCDPRSVDCGTCIEKIRNNKKHGRVKPETNTAKNSAKPECFNP